jgi:hypothetical protein
MKERRDYFYFFPKERVLRDRFTVLPTTHRFLLTNNGVDLCPGFGTVGGCIKDGFAFFLGVSQSVRGIRHGENAIPVQVG